MDTAQLVEQRSAATGYRPRPMRLMTEASTSGDTAPTRRPTRPLAPIAICNNETTMMAPVSTNMLKQMF